VRQVNFVQEINVLGLDLKATGIYIPGDPGKYSGPPENCYPSEPPEVTVHTLVYQDEQQNYNMMPLLESDVGEEICDKCIEAVAEWLCNEH